MMYRELWEYSESIAADAAFWKDGELWSAVSVGVATGVWCHFDPTAIAGIRSHFGDLLGVASIVFGFVLTTLFFYIQAAGSWADDYRVSRVAEKLVNWHIWTVFCLLGLLAYIIVLWALGEKSFMVPWAKSSAYGFLGFMASYSGFQIINHILTIRWAFRRRHALQTGLPPKTSREDVRIDGRSRDVEG